MGLFEQISNDILVAMKAREKEKLEALRGIKKVMIEAKSAAGATGELSDQECLKIIQKLAKQGTDSATIYKEQGRNDLYEQEIFQVKVFDEFIFVEIVKECSHIDFEIRSVFQPHSRNIAESIVGRHTSTNRA